MAQNIETREQLIGQVSLATEKVVDLEAKARVQGRRVGKTDIVRQLTLARSYLQDLKAELEKSSNSVETPPCP